MMGLVLIPDLAGCSVLNGAKKGGKAWSELARQEQARQAALVNSGHVLLGVAVAALVLCLTSS